MQNIDDYNTNPSEIPWSDIGTMLLSCVFRALSICLTKYIDKQELKSNDPELLNCFEDFLNLEYNKKSGTNNHLKAGWKQKQNNEARITKIIIRSFENVQELRDNGKGFYLPSPLSIVNQILTVPEESQSSAYSLVFIRSFLFEFYKVVPKSNLKVSNYKQFDILKIKTVLTTFYSYIIDQNNIPKVPSDHIQLMIAQYLAAKEVFYLRFGTQGKNPIEDENTTIELVKQFLEDEDIDGRKIGNQAFEFRISPYYSDLPSADVLINELTGIPIPFRGADTVFQGGIKTDSNTNLVVRLSGEPGTGKTSFALALASIMSPFGTLTYYISFEEDEQDLKNRLFSLVPNYLKRLSIYKSDIDDWFVAEKVLLPKKDKINYFLSEYIGHINEIINQKKSNLNTDVLPAVCPLILVIDSIRVLINQDTEDFERFVSKCKELNAVIILISANNEKDHNEIDYMVDLVIHLKHVGTENQATKPIRIFQLSKTRHQVSRTGSHIFHLSGEKGFRLSPQLPSQIDKKEKLVKPQPSKEYYIDLFNRLYSSNNKDKILIKKTSEKRKLKIWNKSQILFHGYGSSGKSGLALSLLLSPLQSQDSSKKEKLNAENFRRKVLIVSLLYPEAYYDDLKIGIVREICSVNSISDYKPKIKTIYFYSGYLTPEDFISRILRHLDSAILEGEPFTGILLDGLHNVSLQFQNLQNSDMVWPTLYSLLIKYRLTVVSTFTYFMIDKIDKKLSVVDDEILLKGQLPLLHSLVQSNDYYFTVQPPNEEEKSRNYEGKYIVALKSGIRHELKDEKYVWDREEKKLLDYNSVANNPTLFDNYL